MPQCRIRWKGDPARGLGNAPKWEGEDVLEMTHASTAILYDMSYKSVEATLPPKQYTYLLFLWLRTGHPLHYSQLLLLSRRRAQFKAHLLQGALDHINQMYTFRMAMLTPTQPLIITTARAYPMATACNISHKHQHQPHLLHHP